jgi:hypothetical protein
MKSKFREHRHQSILQHFNQQAFPSMYIRTESVTLLYAMLTSVGVAEKFTATRKNSHKNGYAAMISSYYSNFLANTF